MNRDVARFLALEDEPEQEPLLGIGHLNIVPVVAAELCNQNECLESLFAEKGAEKPHNENYFEQTIPSYSPSTFKEHFRMSASTLEKVTQIVGNSLDPTVKHFHSIEKKVCFTIWMMTKPESFLAGSDRFGLSKSTGHLIFHQVVQAIANTLNDHIIWPDEAKQKKIAEAFAQRQTRGFPGIVGVIDGTHIQIKQPIMNSHDYYNRKKHHSIILQAVCDENCKLTDVSTGYPGRMHDARVFRLSPLGRALSGNQPIIHNREEHHIIADSAYPLSTNVITPYKDNGHLTLSQVNFNRHLSSCRSTIERAFGLLKGKFRRLKLTEHNNLEMINSLILACCIVHNIILDDAHDEEFPENEDDVQEEEDDDDDDNGEGNDDYGPALGIAAVQKRNMIRDTLSM